MVLKAKVFVISMVLMGNARCYHMDDDRVLPNPFKLTENVIDSKIEIKAAKQAIEWLDLAAAAVYITCEV